MALGTLNLSRTKATGANTNGLIGSVDNSLNLADIRLPGSVGLAVGMGNVVTKGNALAANTALSHFDTSKFGPEGTKSLYIFCFSQIDKQYYSIPKPKKQEL